MSITNQQAFPSAPSGHRPQPAIAARTQHTPRKGRNLLLNVPIAGRLTLGFLAAALIVAIAVGTVSTQRSASLSRQADFYQSLLETNTDLTSGANFLQLMNTETHAALAIAASPAPSVETLTAKHTAIENLATLFDNTLKGYVSGKLLNQHPDQVSLITEAGQAGQVAQQQTLVNSTSRTWGFYRIAQEQILQDITANNITDAQTLEQSQGEPTNADALSALRALIQFDRRLATSVRQAASVEEQNQLLTTLIAVLASVIAIGLVGWSISSTLVKRLHVLRHITQAVESGQLESRVVVIGRDEIAAVSHSVNAMLDTMVGLLQETRSQSDALTNAARYLFSYMQIVSAGELRSSTATSDDPIGMLTDAFNFTVGRFRRFVLRTQTNVEQLETISRQAGERAEIFRQALHAHQLGTSREGTGNLPDLKRLETAFIQDVMALARQVNAVARELRANTTTFKVEATDQAQHAQYNEPVTMNYGRTLPPSR